MNVPVRPPMPLPTAQPAQPAPPRQHFKPSARGRLQSITETPHLVRDLAPESPRPVEMLQGVKVESDLTLTAFDHGVYEYLQSWSYEHDKQMDERAYRLPMSTLRRFLGPHTKSDEVEASLKKLSSVYLSYTLKGGPRYIGVQMIVGWTELKGDDKLVAWQWPEPIREIMRDMGVSRYAHIELVPLTTDGMSSRYSAPLYKWLAFEAAQHKWVAGEANTFEVRIKPERLASEVDFPIDENGKFNVGKLTKFVTETFIADMKNVRRFSVVAKPDYGVVRGRKIVSYIFKITLKPPSMHHVRVRYDKAEFRRGGKDDPHYRVRSDLWLRASKAFSVEGSPMHGLVHWKIFELWLVALQEALDNKGLTEGFSTREYRGESLLMTIEAEGADFAAWGFLSEEVIDPDLIDHLQMIPGRKARLIKSLAENGRRDRVGWKTERRRKLAQKSYDQTIEWQELEQREAEEAAFAAKYGAVVEEVVQPVSFDTCTKAHIYFSLPVADLERRIFAKLQGLHWTGSRIFTLVSHFKNERDEPDTYELDIAPTEDEWCTLLNKLSAAKDGLEIYE
ncbi:hypothetical protein ABIA16_003532 [Sinorhizobium fredii]